MATNMALYLAERIEIGKLDYKAVFSIIKYQILEPDVDAMLIVDGFASLIVPIF